MDKAKPAFGRPISEWSSWFAWHPVQAWSGEWLWFKVIQRRRCQLYGYLYPQAPILWWQYQRKD